MLEVASWGSVAAQRHTSAGNPQLSHGLKALLAYDDNLGVLARELLFGLGVVAL